MIPPIARMTPPQLPVRSSSMPHIVRSFPPCCISMDIMLPTSSPDHPSPQPHPITCSSSREAHSVDPQPKLAPAVVQLVSTTSVSPSYVTPAKVTPVISINTPVCCCPAVVQLVSITFSQPSQVTPGQVTPVNSVNAPGFSPLQATENSAVIPSSPSAAGHNAANLNEFNNSFK